MTSDDPEEVEAAQGVEREQAFGLRGRRLHGGEAFLARRRERSTRNLPSSALIPRRGWDSKSVPHSINPSVY
jgi:hypothetical protein